MTTWQQSPDHCTGAFIEGDFASIWFSDAQRGFAVGNAGVFGTSDGGASWHCADSNMYMNAVWGVAANQIYAVGNDGFSPEAMTFDGTTWTTHDLSGGNVLTGVWSAAPGSGLWVTGGFGDLYSWDGANTLTDKLADGNDNLSGIWGADASHFIAVGASQSGGSYACTNYNYPTYYCSSSGDGLPLAAISGVDAANVWAAGPNGVIEKFTSSAWTTQTSGTTSDLYGVWAADVAHVWAVGAGGVIQSFDGASWSAATSPTDRTLRGACGVDDSHAWAAGDDGTILAMAGSAWADQTTGNGAQIASIAMLDPTHAWAVTIEPDRILRLDETGWHRDAAALGATPTQVFALDSSNVWIVTGASSIWRWNGSAWTAQATTETLPIGGIWASDASHAWAVGWSGNAIAWTGSSWVSTPTGTQGLYAISGVDASHIWAVGYEGAIVMWNGAEWVGQIAPAAAANKFLGSVYAADTTHVWAASEADSNGQPGVMLFYDGAMWTTQTIPTTGSVEQIWGTDATHVWAVTTAQQILFFDGTSWAVQYTDPDQSVTAIGGCDESHILAGGGDGLILDGTP